MLKKVKDLLNIIIGTTIGVYIGNVLFTVYDYRAHPGLYAMQSAPWYTRIVALGAMCCVLLAIEILAADIVRRRIKQGKA